eukprot:m.58222 g.58222  ORF g.58222 m.58222 type:complete len:53 (-) comp11161_c1_seq2:4091-4249(-)
MNSVSHCNVRSQLCIFRLLCKISTQAFKDAVATLIHTDTFGVELSNPIQSCE